MAKVVSISVDTRREIDLEIQRVCEEFTADTVRSIAEPLSTFLIKLSTRRAADNDGQSQQHQIPALMQAIDQFKEAISERLPYVQTKMREYINDAKMEDILLGPIHVHLVDEYRQFHHAVATADAAKMEPLTTPLPEIDAIAQFIAQHRVAPLPEDMV
ncbi:hypothetical protein BC940DRAFT_166801 [Gongronella butleri]|nr:hypothetical protein BC940DRAFT_166801 [Gongronella butleri]